jgi:hypothetical protein
MTAHSRTYLDLSLGFGFHHRVTERHSSFHKEEIVEPASAAQSVVADHAAGTVGDSGPSMAGGNLGYPRLEIGSRWCSSLVAVAVDDL